MIPPEELAAAQERSKERRFKTRSLALTKAAERRPILFSAPTVPLPVKDTDPLEKHIAARVERYGIEAMDACRDIALMPINLKNPALVRVKLDACVQLMSKLPANVMVDQPAGMLDPVLAQLNLLWHEKSIRIKSLRTQTEITVSSDNQGNTIEHE